MNIFTKKNLKHSNITGFAALEFAGILLVLLPFILAALALVEKAQTQRDLEQVVSNAVDQLKLKPYVVNTGDQGYFFGTNSGRDSQEKLQNLSSINDNCLNPGSVDSASIQADICASYRYLLNRLKSSTLCAPHGCTDPKLYRIDMKFIRVPISITTGHASRDSTGQLYEEAIYFQKQYGGDLPQSSAQIAARENEMRNGIARFITKNNGTRSNDPFAYAIASPLYGTTISQFYGNWNSHSKSKLKAGEDPNRYRNYLRFVFLVAVGVEVDISKTMAGRFETYMNYLTPGSATDTPRKTVYVSRIVAPRNLL